MSDPLNSLMSESHTPALDAIVEAALLASDGPLELDQLLRLFDEHEMPSRGALRAALTTLEQRLTGTAMVLHESASGFRLSVASAFSPWISRLWEERPQRYSRALMETLALIAYRQPVTRGDIEEVRGVTVSASIMRTLMDRGWIRVIGQRDVPGRPSVYATTRAFLDDFGLKTLDQLPSVHDLKAQAEQHDALVHQSHGEQDADEAAQRNALILAHGDHDDEASDGSEWVPAEMAAESLDFAALDARLAQRMQSSDDDPEMPSDARQDDAPSEAKPHDERSFDE